MLRRDEGAELDVLFGGECLVARELLPNPDERALQAGETLLENEITLAVLPMDRVQVSLMEDGPGRPTPRVGAVLLEDPDMALPLERVRIEPGLQVGLRDGVLLLVSGHLPLRWVECRTCRAPVSELLAGC
jgi:hypothetical protein